VGATPSPLLVSYLHHCLALSILKPLHFFALLPTHTDTSRPIQLGTLLLTAEQFIPYLKPSVGLRECYLTLHNPHADRESPASQFEEESLEVIQVLLKTCIFMAEVVSGKVRRAQLQALSDQILANTCTAIRTLVKATTKDTRTSSMLVIACHRFPDLFLQLKHSCEAAVQVLSQGSVPLQLAARDLHPALATLLLIYRRKEGDGGRNAPEPGFLAFQDLFSSSPPSLAFLVTIHSKMRRTLSLSNEGEVAQIERVILARGISQDRAIFELYLAALMGLANVRQQELLAGEITAPTSFFKASSVWQALVLAKIPCLVQLLVAKDSDAEAQVDFEPLAVSLSHYTSLVGLCSSKGFLLITFFRPFPTVPPSPFPPPLPSLLQRHCRGNGQDMG